jgi:hypothetical protein
MNIANPDFYNFLCGPGFAISVTVFILVFIFRSFQLIRSVRKISRHSIEPGNTPFSNLSPAGEGLLMKVISFFRAVLRNSIFGSHTVTGSISLIFHILLFITPVFLTAHNIVADLAIGLSLPEIPERIADIFTVALIAMGGFFLARRLFIPHVRMISTARDYLIIILVMAPFISGFLAYHHFFNYKIMIFFHMIAGEIAIIVLPFTSLVHMPFFIFSRFCIDSEYSFIAGNRSW